MIQVYEHEAMVRVMAGASPARSFQRHHGSTLRRRHRQLSAAVAADRLKNAVPGTQFFISYISVFVLDFNTLIQ